MKKNYFVIVGLVFIALAIFVSCSKKEVKKQINLVMATGGTSGTYYPYGGAVAQVLGTSIPGLNINVQSTGASAANIRLISSKEADIAIVQNDVMSYAYNGTDLFGNGKIGGFLTMATVYSEVCQIIADPASGIKSVSDLKGKRVSIGDAGSGVESNAIQIMSAYGLTVADIKAQNLSFGDSASAIKDKKIDAFFCTAGTPTTAIVELSTTNPVTIVPIDSTHSAELIKKYPYYTNYVISAGTYKGMTTDVNTLAVKATFIVREDLDPELVYNMTKALFDRKNEIAQAHAKGWELKSSSAVEGASVPLHPGALKYYKEIGVVK